MVVELRWKWNFEVEEDASHISMHVHVQNPPVERIGGRRFARAGSDASQRAATSTLLSPRRRHLWQTNTHFLIFLPLLPFPKP